MDTQQSGLFALVVILIIVCSTEITGAQSVTLHVDRPAVTNDHLTTDLRVHTSNGAPYLGLTSRQLYVEVNGRVQEAIDLMPYRPHRVPLQVIFVVDHSHSMKEANWDTVVATVRDAQTFLQEEDEVHLITFADSVRQSRLVNASWDDRVWGLKDLPVEGHTRLYDGLMTALDVADTAAGAEPVIVLLSDGKDTTSEATKRQVRLKTEEVGARVYTLGYSEPIDEECLRQLAERTGGLYSYSPDYATRMGLYQHLLGSRQHLYRMRVPVQARELRSLNNLRVYVQENEKRIEARVSFAGL